MTGYNSIYKCVALGPKKKRKENVSAKLSGEEKSFKMSESPKQLFLVG